MSELNSPDAEPSRVGRRAFVTSMGVAGAAVAAGVAAVPAAAAQGSHPPTTTWSVAADELRQVSQPDANAIYLLTDPGLTGPFALDAADTTSADDGATVLVTTKGYRMKRLGTDGVYDVRWFGAAGDGSSDDTAAFQAAFAAAAIKTLRIPAGTYVLRSYVIVPAGVGVEYDAGAVIPDSRLIDARAPKYKFDGVAYLPQKVAPYLEYNASERYLYDPVFHIDPPGGMQGVTYWNGFYYVAFTGGSGATIRQYTTAGVMVSASPPLPLGHAAEISYRASNGHLYVVTGDATTPTTVSEVAFSGATSTVVSKLDFSSVGNSGLVAIDNERDLLVVHGAPNDSGPLTFVIAQFDGTIIHQFGLPNQGTPQGMDVSQSLIYYYTNSKITVLDYNGTIVAVIPASIGGRESEGLTISGDYFTPSITIGFNSPDQLYALRTPENLGVFHSYQPLGSPNAQSSGNVSLVPKIAAFAINNNSGVDKWAAAGWTNGFNFNELIASIATSSTAITVTLRQAFESIGYFDVSPSISLVQAGYSASLNVTGSGSDTVTIQIFDGTTVVDPTKLAAGQTLKVVIFGGLRLGV